MQPKTYEELFEHLVISTGMATVVSFSTEPNVESIMAAFRRWYKKIAENFVLCETLGLTNKKLSITVEEISGVWEVSIALVDKPKPKGPQFTVIIADECAEHG